MKNGKSKVEQRQSFKTWMACHQGYGGMSSVLASQFCSDFRSKIVRSEADCQG
jgi:hypothetical protein